MFASELVGGRRTRLGLLVVFVCAYPATLIGAAADVSNAALLYYQAMILAPDMDRFPDEVVRGVMRGTAGAEDVKRYVRLYDGVLETVEAATQISQCNWGIPIARPTFEVEAMTRSKTILFLFGASVRVHAENGDYDGAFEQLRQLRQFAAHAAGEPGLSEALPAELDSCALSFWRHTMGITPLDEERLEEFRDDLIFDPIPPNWLLMVLRFEFERVLHAIREDESYLSQFRTRIPPNHSAAFRAKLQTYADMEDEELLECIAQEYEAFMEDVFEVLAADLPYEEGYQRLESLATALRQASLDEPAIIMDWVLNAKTVPGYYTYRFYHKAILNVTRAAVEVYRVQIQTGRLPQVLPDGLPKDPLSGSDLGYEVTSDGFILSHAADETYGGAMRFEFRICN